MAILLAAVALGLGFAYFAVQNPQIVTVQLGQFLVYELPLYIVALGSLFVGLALSWILSFVNEVGTAFTLSGKEREIKKTHDYALELERKVRELEYENRVLKGENREIRTEQVKDRLAHIHTGTQSFFGKLRHNLLH